MTKFADQLFDDLMREHGPALTAMRAPAAPKRRVAHPTLLTAGAAVAAVAATAGVLTAGGGTPAYAVTANADGTVTLDVYSQSGIAGANQALQKMGDNKVVVVPAKAGCPSITSLPLVSIGSKYVFMQVNGTDVDPHGKITVNPHRIPKGDILLMPVELIGKNTFALSSPPVKETIHGQTGLVIKTGVLTRPGAPSCVSVPKSSLTDTVTGSSQG